MKVKHVVDWANDVRVHFDDVKKWYEEHLAPDVIDFEDPEPYEVYEKAKWAGIFQLTSAGAQRLFVKAKPQSIIDIATLTSIYRPGPLAANVDKLYLEAKAGKELEWGDKRLNEILRKTYTCLSGNARVLTENGEVTIKELVEGSMIGVKLPSYNESTGQLESDEIVAVAHNGVKDIIELEMDDGTTLSVTEDHLVMTKRGWIPAGELTIDDEVISVM